MAERSRWHPAAVAEWALVAALIRLFATLPEGLAYGLAEAAGRLAYRLDARHRRITQDNLAKAFPGALSGAGLERMAQAVFEGLGRTAADVARSDRLRDAPADACRIEGLERLQAARSRGRGVLLLTAHFGPWELLPLIASLRYEPIHVVARPLDNPRLDDLLTRLRERGGNRVIRKRDALQAILKALRRGETVGMLIDQHIAEREGVVVPFFGRPASTVFAPALLALRSGAAILPVVIYREGRGRFCIRLGEEIPLLRTGDLRTDLVRNTARFNLAIEDFIRARPDHWFWVHRRWKTNHPLDKSMENWLVTLQ